jgi:hypothetical protein
MSNNFLNNDTVGYSNVSYVGLPIFYNDFINSLNPFGQTLQIFYNKQFLFKQFNSLYNNYITIKDVYYQNNSNGPLTQNLLNIIYPSTPNQNATNNPGYTPQGLILTNPPLPLSETITDFPTLPNIVLNNAIINVNEYGNYYIELSLPPRILSLVIDQSGSMTWNDSNGLRYNVIEEMINT